ncbi:MAG: hypothetical protein LIP12_09025 [Clostridiales bacterium]|nr:hypothetical protein [Clostridiales bacterium]
MDENDFMKNRWSLFYNEGLIYDDIIGNIHLEDNQSGIIRPYMSHGESQEINQRGGPP